MLCYAAAVRLKHVTHLMWGAVLHSYRRVIAVYTPDVGLYCVPRFTQQVSFPPKQLLKYHLALLMIQPISRPPDMTWLGCWYSEPGIRHGKEDSSGDENRKSRNFFFSVGQKIDRHTFLLWILRWWICECKLKVQNWYSSWILEC